VIDADVAVLTNIGRDHTTGEGDWRRDIAGEKAGIAKPNSTFVVGETDPDLLDIFEGEGAASVLVAERDFELLLDQPAVGGRLVDIRTARGLYEDVFVSVHGAHQAANAAIALTATEEFFDAALPDDVVSEAFGELTLPGRVEVVAKEPIIVLDGAHNPEAAHHRRRRDRSGRLCGVHIRAFAAVDCGGTNRRSCECSRSDSRGCKWCR